MSGLSASSGASSELGALRRVWGRLRAFGAYAAAVVDGDKYNNYLRHHHDSHPGVEPMTAGEFWRDYSDWQDKNPAGRCC
ncbi:YbdD/YjiX family protein [Timonella senegalensis]|jgi:uncharacterized short protein YbdD (DUF466 family)|uniref:YbdD/YjiX family protein n=1 Tax=Timonella senegalensis TaxID=1465825 RepID=UPI0003003CCA|nr:YbdD/YjiX family protein [Timonella senegalensis]